MKNDKYQSARMASPMTALTHTIEGTPYSIVDRDGLRLLLLAGDDAIILGEMLLGAPDVLVSPYARLMLNALPLAPRLDDIVMIGVGVGQQTRFLHRRLSTTRLVGVDVDPRVFAIARSWFRVPPDDERLSMVVDDGRNYVQTHPESCDVLLCDACDPHGKTADSLTDTAFYVACARALRPGGVMARHMDRRCSHWHAGHLSLLKQVFPHHLELPVDQNQSVLLLFKDGPERDHAALRQRALALDAMLDLDLGSFVGRIDQPW